MRKLFFLNIMIITGFLTYGQNLSLWTSTRNHSNTVVECYYKLNLVSSGILISDTASEIREAINLINEKISCCATNYNGGMDCMRSALEDLGASGAISRESNDWHLRLDGENLYFDDKTYMNFSRPFHVCGQNIYLAVYERSSDNSSLLTMALHLIFKDEETKNDMINAFVRLRHLINKK